MFQCSWRCFPKISLLTKSHYFVFRYQSSLIFIQYKMIVGLWSQYSEMRDSNSSTDGYSKEFHYTIPNYNIWSDYILKYYRLMDVVTLLWLFIIFSLKKKNHHHHSRIRLYGLFHLQIKAALVISGLLWDL